MIVASFGLLVWFILAATFRPTLAVAVLWFAPLVIVPLGLSLVRQIVARESGAQHLLRAVQYGQLPAALLLTLSWRHPPSATATIFTSGWLLLTLVGAAAALAMIGPRKSRQPVFLLSAAALLFMAVGAVWTSISRAGLRPLGFSPEIVLLTGVHFHYAGFALPLIAAFVLRLRATPLAMPLTVGIVVGVPLVGLGITVSALSQFVYTAVEFAAVLLLVSACLLLVVLQLKAARGMQKPIARTLLLVSAASLATGMSFAMLWSVSQFCEAEWIDLQQMVATHGCLNAFGFSFAGLLGAWLGAAKIENAGPPLSPLEGPQSEQ